MAPIEWLLQVKERAHCAPLGRVTPHCFSTSTGPFGLAVFCLGSSFFFFFFDSLPSSSSALRFLPFLLPSSVPFVALFLALFWPMLGLSPSALSGPSSSLSSPAFRRFAASRASFFLRAFSCLAFKQPRTCSAAVCLRVGRLQCLQITVSRRSSSRGLPVGNTATTLLSRTGRGEAVGEVSMGPSLASMWIF